MVDKAEAIYKAIRKAYGYGSEADELVDALGELMGAYEAQK